MIALISVHDKTGVSEFALSLAELGFEIYSTGGTQKRLAEVGLPVHSVSSLTGFPEILDGRVKTLHPLLHGGILARRDRPEHMEELARNQIPPIDLVCVNLYPFVETVERLGAMPPASAGGGGALPPGEEEALENIDIGGPTLIRAAAKNYPSVLVVVDPEDYGEVLERLRMESVPLEYRRRLAEKAFQHVASYDTAVAQYLRGDEQFPERMTIGLAKALHLRYGENPHQRAALYREERAGRMAGGIVDARQLHGKEMSYLNILDADAAWAAVCEFAEPAVAIVKHTSPCGMAVHEDLAEAYRRALAGDPMSAFGGIVALNRELTAEAAQEIGKTHYDIIVAPGFEEAALALLRKKRDLRVLQVASLPSDRLEYRSVSGGLLVQTTDRLADEEIELRVVTKRAPTARELADLRFAWRAVKLVKSNAIVVARERAMLGMGSGQPNRLEPVRLALAKAGEGAKGAVLASDAFFPFARDDAVELACRAGITAIVQPGGAMRDKEAIEVCDEFGAAMVFTGVRAFRH